MASSARSRILDVAESMLAWRTWRNVAAGAAFVCVCVAILWVGLTPVALMLLAIVLMLAALLCAVAERT